MRKGFLISLLLLFVALPAYTWNQYGQEPEAGKMPEMQEPGQDPAAFQTAEGKFSKVDPANKTLWIITADGTERQFLYTDQTQVEGADGTVEGLAGENGQTLRIHFESSAGVDSAIKIEVLREQAEA